MINASPTIQRANTILYCRAWRETVAFYKEQIGLPTAFANDWFVEFQLNESAFLSVADSARASIRDVQGQGITLAWKVADLPLVRARLTAQGIAVTLIEQKWGAWVFYCYDPEGHRLEFWSDKEDRNG